MVEESDPRVRLMTSLSPEQTLVLAAIERFRDDPELAASDGPSPDGDVLDAVVRALSLVLPPEEIELAVTGLLGSHAAAIDEDTQWMLEALLAAVEADDEAGSLEYLLEAETPLIEANALESSLLLVWDPAVNPPLRELAILDLLAAYPCRGAGARWSPDDFVDLLERRALQWDRTLEALDRLERLPGSEAQAGTVILVVPEEEEEPLLPLEVTVTLGRAEEEGPA